VVVVVVVVVVGFGKLGGYKGKIKTPTIWLQEQPLFKRRFFKMKIMDLILSLLFLLGNQLIKQFSNGFHTMYGIHETYAIHCFQCAMFS